MEESTNPSPTRRDPEAGRPTRDEAAPSWSQQVRLMRGGADADERARPDGPGAPREGSGDRLPPPPAGEAESSLLEEGLARLRDAAREAALVDAARDRPDLDATEPTEQETTLRERCRALFERWSLAERRRVRDTLTDREERAAALMGEGGLRLDRFERLSNELIRLKARRLTHRQAVTTSLENREDGANRGLPTKLYAVAIGFLGLVEFFANAPVFSTLLPRDPLTERQIRVVAETTTGWIAGAERVLAQLVLRPDAALLAAGVVTFLCLLAHFFGHSLRELVMHGDGRSRRDTMGTRSPMENAVPMVLTGLGLVLVLGVLFEARVILGEVGERRYQDDMAAVTELRREAGWMRTDGELLAANERSDRADDMEAAATRLREYAASMSRMTFPILLLNLTLVLAAITAAYFHRRDATEEHFNDDPYEDSRATLVEAAEATAAEVSDILSRAVRPVRELLGLTEDGFSRDPRGVVRQLESVVTLYRRENARARDIDPEAVAAFRGPVDLGIPADARPVDLAAFRRPAEEAEEQLRELAGRFREARERFNRHLTAWHADEESA